MINSRKLEDLYPVVKRKAEHLLNLCTLEDIDLLITSTYRDEEAQQALYDQGRTKPGPVVTRARPLYSYHNFRVAFDVVPLRQGKPVWGTMGPDLKLWLHIGAMGKACGLDWAGDWTNMREFPHFQYTGGLSLQDLRDGKIPEERRAS